MFRETFFCSCCFVFYSVADMNQKVSICFAQQHLTAYFPACRNVDLPAGDAAQTLRRRTQRHQRPRRARLRLQPRRPPRHHGEDQRVRFKGQPLEVRGTQWSGRAPVTHSIFCLCPAHTIPPVSGRRQ